MSRSKIIIPAITGDELFDFPTPTASSADVFQWVMRRCHEAELHPSHGPVLSQNFALTGHILHTRAISQIMVKLRAMGFSGNRKGTSLDTARRIAGFILAARRWLAEHVEGVEGEGEEAEENLQPAEVLATWAAELPISKAWASFSTLPTSMLEKILEPFSYVKTEKDSETGLHSSQRSGDEKEFEVGEEENVIHDKGFIQGVSDEYEEMLAESGAILQLAMGQQASEGFWN